MKRPGAFELRRAALLGRGSVCSNQNKNKSAAVLLTLSKSKSGVWGMKSPIKPYIPKYPRIFSFARALSASSSSRARRPPCTVTLP